MPSAGVTVAEAAAKLGVARVSLSRLINQRASVSPEMALRLARWLGGIGGGSAAEWLARQASHDIGLAAGKMREALKTIKPAVKTGG